jgi:transposase
MPQAPLPHELWSLIEPHLPVHQPSPKGGRPRIDDRAALTGILDTTQATRHHLAAVEASKRKGTAVYGTVRTVGWEDGGGTPPPTRFYVNQTVHLRPRRCSPRPQ